MYMLMLCSGTPLETRRHWKSTLSFGGVVCKSGDRISCAAIRTCYSSFYLLKLPTVTCSGSNAVCNSLDHWQACLLRGGYAAYILSTYSIVLYTDIHVWCYRVAWQLHKSGRDANCWLHTLWELLAFLNLFAQTLWWRHCGTFCHVFVCADAVQAPSLLDLPPELLLRVFSLLSPVDLCHLSQVHPSLHALAFDGSLWQHLHPVRWANGHHQFFSPLTLEAEGEEVREYSACIRYAGVYPVPHHSILLHLSLMWSKYALISESAPPYTNGRTLLRVVQWSVKSLHKCVMQLIPFVEYWSPSL